MWTLSLDCFITFYPEQHWQAAARTLRATQAALEGPRLSFLFAFQRLLGTQNYRSDPDSRSSLGVALVYAPSTFIPNILKRTPPGSPQMTGKPLHYSAQYVSKGCVQIQGFSCQMYSLFPRLSCYNEMENKQDILISYSTRKWDFPPSLSLNR